MREKKHTTIEHDAVPIVAAETVVTRHLKIVDEYGNVRAAITTDIERGEDGPRLEMYDRNGRPLVVLTIVDGTECHGVTHLWMADQHDDREVSLCVGSLRGPGVHFRNKRLDVHVGAEHKAALIESRDSEATTAMEIVPGEQPATFLEGAEGESKEATS